MLDLGTGFTKTENGYIDDQSALEWLHNSRCKRTPPARPHAFSRSITTCSYPCHETFEFREFALAHSIYLFSYRGHSTYFLQPLDVGIFNPIVTYCEREVEEWSHKQTFGQAIHEGDAIPMIEQVTLHRYHAPSSFFTVRQNETLYPIQDSHDFTPLMDHLKKKH